MSRVVRLSPTASHAVLLQWEKTESPYKTVYAIFCVSVEDAVDNIESYFVDILEILGYKRVRGNGACHSDMSRSLNDRLDRRVRTGRVLI